MIQVGQELVLGEAGWYLEVFNIVNFKITHTKQFKEIGQIFDMIAIENSD